MGVLIFEGMKVGFLEGDLTISVDESGSVSSNAILSTSYNTLPLWLNLAKENCQSALIANQKIRHSWPDDEEQQKQCLLAELRPSMLTIVSCAIAIDALYDIVKPFAKIDPDTQKGWQKNKKSRVFQISEVFRRVFELRKDEATEIKLLIQEISKLRDKAVHPSHKIENAEVRDDVPVGLDWRFVAYRHHNASIALNNTMALFKKFFAINAGNKRLTQEMENLRKSFVQNLLEDT
ncbi:hypothetical protein RKLH11_2854 [Rhodobacteraceae bacterium KLH11]|nr:hypothetical protein RKLH11_2854 [Rhodobacteraceae bacterium KLH11]